MDVWVKFGDYTLNVGLIIRLYLFIAGWSRYTHQHADFNCSLQANGSSWPRHLRHVYVTDRPR